jgi:hypothetical protein
MKRTAGYTHFDCKSNFNVMKELIAQQTMEFREKEITKKKHIL